MGLISKLLRGHDHFNQPVAAAANLGGAIGYDPDLVGRLKGEHQELVEIFATLNTAMAEGRFTQLPDLLGRFKHSFLNHIGHENVKFYVYMQQHLELDADTLSFVSGVRKEMNDIARAVMKFVDRYITALPSADTVETFKTELQEIGAVLVKRVHMEESRLYSLYRP